MELYRIGIKFFAEETGAVALTELIPVFHRWIQDGLLDDLLFDVADYSHVHAGPGTLLVAHEGNYAYDESGNRRGIVYYAKRPFGENPEQRLAAVCRKALHACQLVEQEESLGGRIRFPGRELQVFANDRLLAPNGEETLDGFRPALDFLLGRLYPGTDCRIESEPDPKERFAVTIDSGTPIPIAELLRRLGG
jgi:hypothetical protein